MRIKTKIVVYLLPIAIVSFIIFSSCFFFFFERYISDLIYDDLDDICVSQKNILSQIIDDNKIMFEFFSENNNIIANISQYNKNNGSSDLKNLVSVMQNKLQKSSVIKNITLIDLTGKIIASTDKNAFEKGHAEIPINIADTSIKVSLFNLENEAVLTNISGPIISDGKVIGILNLDLNQDNFSNKLLVHPGLGNSGETILVRQNVSKDQFIFIHFIPSANGLIETKQNEINASDISYQSIKGLIAGLSNSFINYKGNDSLGTIQTIPGFNWTIITYIEKSEAFQRLHYLFWSLLFGLIVFCTVLYLIMYLIATSITEPISRLTQAIQKYKESKSLETCIINNSPEIELLSDTLKETIYSLAKTNLETQFLSEHDVLTGLPNRRFVCAEIDKMLDAAASKTDSTFAIFFIKINDLGVINEALGYDGVDELLQMLALRLKEYTSNTIALARFEGNLFLEVIRGSSSQDEIAAIASIIINALSLPFIIGKRYFTISANIGIAQYPQDALTTSELLGFSNIAMLAARKDKINSYRFYDEELSEHSRRKIWLNNELTIAIKEKSLEMYYQPQIDVITNTIIGVESLMRWQHPTAGFISPDEFIGLAEKNEQIHKLLELTVCHSFRDFNILRAAGIVIEKMSINLSAINFEKLDLVKYLFEQSQQFDIPTHNITLEITEGLFITNITFFTSVITQLKSLGFSIALDDFGKGFSSLNILSKLPIDTLKIDKEFVEGLPLENNAKSIALTIIDLAKNLNKKVLAEGTETMEQVQWLRDHGCHLFQGYYFAKPMSINQLIAFFKSWPSL